MKRIITLSAVICAAVLFVSGCKIDQNPGLSAGLTLSVHSDSPETRAGEAAFEDVIDHFDFFFFKDAAGTQPVAGMHARVTGSTATLETGVTQTYAALRSITSYLYVLANYSGEIDHTADWTLEQLLALPVNDSIVTKKVLAENDITHEMEETGAVEFRSSVVMDSYKKADGSYTTELTPTVFEEEGTVDIALTRLEAKLTLTINVPASVTGTMTGETWTPSWNDLRAYYVNALNNKATVSGAPVKRDTIDASRIEDYQYLTYPTRYAIYDQTASGATDHQYMTAPVYTYPQTWKSGDNGEPYFKVQLPWVSNVRGSSNFYYKVNVPKPESGSTTWTIDRNTYYNAVVSLTVLDTDNEYAEVTATYTVAQWSECPFEGSPVPTTAKFFDVPQTEFVLYSKGDLEIPFSSSDAVEAFFTMVSYSYYGAGAKDYDFTFEESDKINSVTLPTTYNGSTIPLAGRDLNEYSLEVVGGKTLVFEHSLASVYTVRTVYLVLQQIVNPSNRVQIKITQHPAIEIKRIKAKNAFVNGWFGRATKDVRDANGNLIGSDPFTPTHTPDPDNDKLYHAYSYASPESNASANSWSTSTASSKYIDLGSSSSSASSISANYQGFLGSVNGDVSTAAKDLCSFEITVSAFNDDNKTFKVEYRNSTTYNGGTGTVHTRNYRIGDPRVPVSQYLTEDEVKLPYYLASDRAHRDPETDVPTISSNSTFGTWEEPMKILIADQGVNANEVIAPRFLVSSPMNVMYGSISNTNSLRRAMTYQENGYPAGRWRLPTEAEIAFIVARQKEGVIPWLFAGTYYQCANGRAIYVRTGDAYRLDPPISVQATNCYNRFVYDLWYWGDDPTASHTPAESTMTEWEKATDPVSGQPNWKAHWANYYHPNMHEH